MPVTWTLKIPEPSVDRGKIVLGVILGITDD